MNPSNEDIFENTSEVEDLNQGPENENILFENYEKKDNLEKVFSDLSFHDDLPEVDEDTFIFMINCFNSIDSNNDDHRQIRKLMKSLIFFRFKLFSMT